jgi:hypothetical protein
LKQNCRSVRAAIPLRIGLKPARASHYSDIRPRMIVAGTIPARRGACGFAAAACGSGGLPSGRRARTLKFTWK